MSLHFNSLSRAGRERAKMVFSCFTVASQLTSMRTMKLVCRQKTAWWAVCCLSIILGDVLVIIEYRADRGQTGKLISLDMSSKTYKNRTATTHKMNDPFNSLNSCTKLIKSPLFGLTSNNKSKKFSIGEVFRKKINSKFYNKTFRTQKSQKL